MITCVASQCHGVTTMSVSQAATVGCDQRVPPCYRGGPAGAICVSKGIDGISELRGKAMLTRLLAVYTALGHF
jgi:hypothetical protein